MVEKFDEQLGEDIQECLEDLFDDDLAREVSDFFVTNVYASDVCTMMDANRLMEKFREWRETRIEGHAEELEQRHREGDRFDA